MSAKFTIDDYNKEIKKRNLSYEAIKEYAENGKTYIECKCKKCGNTFSRERKQISSYMNCPVCANKIVVKGYNDVATTDPWVISLLKDKEDAYIYTRQANRLVTVICPECGIESDCHMYSITSRHPKSFANCKHGNHRIDVAQWNKIINNDVEVVGEHNVNDTNYIDCKCKKCGQDFSKTRINFRQTPSCPVCNGQEVVRGINDIATTDSWAVKYFVNEEDAYTHSKRAQDKVPIRCPQCEKINKIRIYNFIHEREKNHNKGCKTCTPQQLRLSLDEIKEKYKKKHPNLSIVNYDKDNDIYTFYCDKCGVKFTKDSANIRYYGGCNVCFPTKTIKGINDIATTAPWLVPYIIDKEYCYTHTAYSKQKTLMKCTTCDYERMASPIQFIRFQRYSCPMCSDGISYPNKFGREFLKQLPIQNFQCEYQDDWTNGKIFDNYFEYNGIPYLVEMDGAIHYKNSKYTSVEKCQANDRYKDQLCKDKGIELIRIDCKESKPNYIKNSILNSRFAELFDLSNIDWDKCDQFASVSAIKIICDCYNEHPTMTQHEMADYLKIPYSRVNRYLHKGAKLGLCDYNEDIAIQNKLNKSSELFGFHIIAYDLEMNVIGEYSSMEKTIKGIKEKFPDKTITQWSLKRVLNGVKESHNGIIYKRVN